MNEEETCHRCGREQDDSLWAYPCICDECLEGEQNV